MARTTWPNYFDAMNYRGKLKIILGTVAVIGILLQGVELYFKPIAILQDSSQRYPGWLYWLSVITFCAALGYFCLEYVDCET